ncbi:MAG TPA: DMT family transporter [Negativicutes bacterium]|nr:DMT family transporter [Negativicutes bacterium]
MHYQVEGSLFIVASAIGSATLAIFIKVAFAAGANIVTIISVRFLLAALFLLIVLRRRNIALVLPLKRTIQLCLMGLVGYGGMSILFANSLHYLPASLTAMLLYTYPALVALLSFMVGDEPFNGGKLLALVVCLAGLFMVLGISSANAPLIGVFSILGAAAIYSVYIVLGSRLLKSVDPFLATMYICASTGVAALIYGMADNSLLLTLPTKGWLAILGISVFPTIIGISCFFLGLELIGATNAAIICTVEPFVTVLLSTFLLGETITYPQIAGGALIIIGVVILQLPMLKQS